MRSTRVAAAAVALALLASCAGGSSGRPSAASSQPVSSQPVSSTLALPPVSGRMDYQLGGAYPPAAGVLTVSRDRSAAPARGRYSICYVNAFQTQAAELAWWRARHPTLLLRDRAGRLVGDPDWPGEVLLDTRTPANRAAIAGIVGSWIDGCARHGFQAVEPDNLDSYTRSHKLLTEADNVALAVLLAQRAHRKRLAIAQKNAAELTRVGRSKVGFDFAVAEECQVYAECGAYAAYYGRHVLEIEYTDNGAAAFRTACRHRSTRGPVVLRDRDLVPRGSRGYVFAAC